VKILATYAAAMRSSAREGLTIKIRMNRTQLTTQWRSITVTEPTKEYWQAKADLCRATALKQLEEADAPRAMKNLERMVYALSRVGIENKREGEGNE
jgi:hypothetical protein